MGRWAEVYFTTPPEKRDEAVAELIRELENNSSPESAPSQAITKEKSKDEDETAEVSTPPHPDEFTLTCSECGYKNSTEQKFCGMCGAMLQMPHVSEVAGAAPYSGSGGNEQGLFLGGKAGEYTDSSSLPNRNYDDRGMTWSLPEEELPRFAREDESTPYRYRLYVGVALAVLLGLLVYMAWRGTKPISKTAGPQPSKVIPAAPPAPLASAPPPRSTPSGSSEEPSPAPPVPSTNQGQTTQLKNPPNDSHPASRIVSKAANPSDVVPEPSGADDLATAENFLDRGQGRARDSREAALWLWRAVGKGNAEASLVLSDLYLRGDGVPRSCDQARLLLDAAARKGSKAAGARLRNLQAFGCE